MVKEKLMILRCLFLIDPICTKKLPCYSLFKVLSKLIQLIYLWLLSFNPKILNIGLRLLLKQT